MLVPYLRYKLQIFSPWRELLQLVYGVCGCFEVLHFNGAHPSISSFALLALGRAVLSCDTVGQSNSSQEHKPERHQWPWLFVAEEFSFNSRGSEGGRGGWC